MAETKRAEKGDGYDPFAERNNPNATTNWETFAHLLKAALGTGILSMPIAFLYAGLIMGVLATFFTAIICTHCVYLLVKCAHALYYRTRRSTMSYAEISIAAFETGPTWCHGYGQASANIIIVLLFITYFGSCSVYTVIVAKNIQAVLPEEYDYDVRIIISMLIIPLLLLIYIPNLKLLAPVSAFANVLMGISLCITFYYCVQEPPPFSDREYFHFWDLPQFFSICIFAMEAIGVVMPLENNMKTPRSFITPCGVLNCSMFCVSIIYLTMGFVGYWKFGDETAESITLNLPADEIPSKVVQGMIASAVFCTYGLQFVVVLEIVWNPLEKYFPNNPLLGNYICRTGLVFTTVGFAIAVPTIAPFMGLIGALTFSSLGLLMPAVLELIVFSEEGFGFLNWILIKNILIGIFSIFATIFGTLAAMKDILKIYQ